MIDFRLKSECDKLAKEANERLEKLKKELSVELTKFINKNKVNSIELLELLNCMSENQLKAILGSQVKGKAIKNLSQRKSIIIHKN